MYGKSNKNLLSQFSWVLGQFCDICLLYILYSISGNTALHECLNVTLKPINLQGLQEIRALRLYFEKLKLCSAWFVKKLLCYTYSTASLLTSVYYGGHLAVTYLHVEVSYMSRVIVMYSLWIFLQLSPASNFVLACVAFLAWTLIMHKCTMIFRGLYGNMIVLHNAHNSIWPCNKSPRRQVNTRLTSNP